MSEPDREKVYLAHPDPRIRALQSRRMNLVTSAAKSRAVRINGRLGGRPIVLGILFDKKTDPEHQRPIKVAFSRSWGGVVFTLATGERQFWTSGACSSPEEAVVMLDSWWGAPESVSTPDGRAERDFDWYPYWPQGTPIGCPKRAGRKAAKG